MTNVPLPIRIARRYPRARRMLEIAHTTLPYPVSKWAYGLGRSYVFKGPRQRGFERVFAHVANEGRGGDYLEFGVWRGASIILADSLVRAHGMESMRLFAFDSFAAGLPNTEGPWIKGGFSYPQERFRTYIQKAGVDLDRVVTIPGMFDEVLHPRLPREHAIERVAIAHIDCDLYSSTRTVLEFLEHVIDEGTVLIFDDWQPFEVESPENADAFGERTAFLEWRLSDHFRELSEPGDGHKSFVMTRPPSARG